MQPAGNPGRQGMKSGKTGMNQSGEGLVHKHIRVPFIDRRRQITLACLIVSCPVNNGTEAFKIGGNRSDFLLNGGTRLFFAQMHSCPHGSS
jgi:hypothetical protein